MTGEWTDPQEALHDAGLDYEVTQVDAWDDKGNKLPGVLANRRTDTDEIVGVTSDVYGVVQNWQAFSLLDPFCQIGGVIEHAGCTFNGMVFMVMRVSAADFMFNSDTFDLYVCAMNSFNTRFPLAVIITPIRVYCQNMFRKLMKRSDTVLQVKHGRWASDRIMSAKSVVQILTQYREDFVDKLDDDSMTYRTPSQVSSWLEHMMPLVDESPKRPRAKFTNERIRSLRDEFWNDYYLAPDNADYVGTKLGVINAYFDWITHHIPTRASSGYDQITLSNMLSGTAVNRKLLERI